ncbi:MAG TPA: PQQ-binding-like beta-propeller repeat protein [Verrucomicrobiota bacterium]|nr:PQQ-binding-like beta-propeller repeat protein [Verrucomicrobiota bacterium]
MKRNAHWLGLTWAVAFLGAGPALPAADQPQWGQAWSRNQVSLERGLPTSFDPVSGSNLVWFAELGTETHGSPIIAGGRVYIGTNNGHPRDPRHQGDRGVLFCLDEKDGRLLWQLVVPKRTGDIYLDWPNSGICSPATVEGDRVYLVNNRGEVLCLDARGMSNGNQGPFLDEASHASPRTETNTSGVVPECGPLDADILWLFDLTGGAGIYSHDAAHSSILVRGDHLYLNTGTGVDNTHRKIRTPDAPSLVVLDKHTGRLLAREQEGIAPNIFHSTWSAPSLGEVQGRPLIFFAAGNGLLYAFEPLAAHPAQVPTALARAWMFDFDPDSPKTDVHKYVGNRRESPSNFYGMPVFHDGRIYLAGGGDIWWGKREAWLKCVRADVSAPDERKRLAWAYPLQKHVLSTPAVWNGLVFIADCGPTLHCVDAETGQAVWTHSLQGEVWASPLVADDKVYLGTRRGHFYVFAASREKRLLNTVSLGSPISATATAANGVLFVATMNRLYAAKEGARTTPDPGS